ncbi:NAC domain-containing protein 101-like [Silene latifolia]|uniref:NAC domain-containing protein 101-like n=1 Tax=Silene latifolia TaxID=37657 RepID=UPI003D770F38
MASSLPISKVNLVAYFLATRLKKNGALPPYYPQFIDYDIYSDHPFNILASTKQLRGANDVDEGFFFSRLNKTTPNGTRINRCVKGHGTWLQKSKTHQVCIGKKNVVGMEKYFKFKPVDGGSGNGNEDEWTMHEYSLDGNNEMVLCHITKKPDFYR